MKHSIEFKVSTDKMDQEQFNEWVQRQQHGEVKTSVKVLKKGLKITISSNDMYAMEDVTREMQYIIENGY